MIFYSHSRKNEKEEYEPAKELQEHLESVTKNIKLNVHPHLDFNDFSVSPELLNILGLCHDIGKYTTWFQEYLLLAKHKGEAKKNHAFLSAVFAYNLALHLPSGYKFLPFFLFYCIKHHHGALCPPGKSGTASYLLSQRNNFEKQVKNLFKNSAPEIESLTKKHFPDFQPLRLTELLEYNEKIEKTGRLLQKKKAKIDHYFIILYLFSLLISSDKIDAGEIDPFVPDGLSSDKVNQYLASKKDKLLTDIRTQAKDDIENKLNEIETDKDRLFSLTAPTGIGKTLSVINFVLKLKEKIHKLQGYHPQIIYCLPFINIIEQTHKILSDLFEKEKILTHHQYTDIWSMVQEQKGKDEEFSLARKLLEVEDWQKDIILTTFVQFFHSIITNQNRMLKKFYRIAGSIIVLDEIQNVQAEYWPLIGAVLYHLSEFLNCRIILMTATQPLIFEAANREIFEQERIKCRPLLNQKQTEYYFSQFDRTRIISLADKKNPLKNAEEFYNIFSERWDDGKSCLIVVNTIKRSTEVFEKLKKENASPHLYYLSTNIVPVHRKYIIRKIRRLLKEGEKVILVSTQSIEAGVDLDFDMGFRDIGPLDSIIQVAGRINRNNRNGFQNAPLYIVNFKQDAERIYGKIIIRTTREILSTGKAGFSENEYLSLINQYYSLISHEDRSSFENSRLLYNAMKQLRFTHDEEDDGKAVEDFQLIEDTKKAHYADVFVVITKNASRILNIYMNEYLVSNNFKEKKELYLKIKSAFNQYKISVPRQIIRKLDDHSNGIRELIPNKLYYISEDYIGKEDEGSKIVLYDYCTTGFCRKVIESETLIF